MAATQSVQLRPFVPPQDILVRLTTKSARDEATESVSKFRRQNSCKHPLFSGGLPRNIYPRSYCLSPFEPEGSSISKYERKGT